MRRYVIAHLISVPSLRTMTRGSPSCLLVVVDFEFLLIGIFADPCLFVVAFGAKVDGVLGR